LFEVRVAMIYSNAFMANLDLSVKSIMDNKNILIKSLCSLGFYFPWWSQAHINAERDLLIQHFQMLQEFNNCVCCGPRLRPQIGGLAVSSKVHCFFNAVAGPVCSCDLQPVSLNHLDSMLQAPSQSAWTFISLVLPSSFGSGKGRGEAEEAHSPSGAEPRWTGRRGASVRR